MAQCTGRQLPKSSWLRSTPRVRSLSSLPPLPSQFNALPSGRTPLPHGNAASSRLPSEAHKPLLTSPAAGHTNALLEPRLPRYVLHLLRAVMDPVFPFALRVLLLHTILPLNFGFSRDSRARIFPYGCVSMVSFVALPTSETHYHICACRSAEQTRKHIAQRPECRSCRRSCLRCSLALSHPSKSRTRAG